MRRTTPFLLLPLSLLTGCDQPSSADATMRASVNSAGSADTPIVDPLVEYTEVREPCRDRDPLRRAYFGDLHLHTGFSFDAYLNETESDPYLAYERASTTVDLDFAAVTDHAEFLAETSLCTDPDSPSYDTTPCAVFRDGPTGNAGFALLASRLVVADPSHPPVICGDDGSLCAEALAEVWGRVQDAAQTYYDRSSACAFTTFVAYEYTANTGGSNLHRNVIFRNADVPSAPLSYIEAPSAPQLWSMLDAGCGGNCDVLAIPHNSNMSNGDMFSLAYLEELDTQTQVEQAALRASMEPLMEVFQHKGASECRPGFSPDEACQFEMLAEQDPCNGDGTGSGAGCAARTDYLRGALAEGLAKWREIGVNPLRLGVIASTDSHNGVPGVVDEGSFAGHLGDDDDTPQERLVDNGDSSPGGLAGVWAVENSRDAVFEALRRRETFGTSGPRIQVRLFGGWDLEADACNLPDLVAQGYAGGVPMGGSLGEPPSPLAKPRFVVLADQDTVGLQKAEIVKVWVDAAGEAHEQVFPVAGGDNGATVDTQTCEPVGEGAATLCGTWVDTAYRGDEPVAYYVRVLENPTCRWSQYDCNALPEDERPDECETLSSTLQERAWTSPIWSGEAQ